MKYNFYVNYYTNMFLFFVFFFLIRDYNTMNERIFFIKIKITKNNKFIGMFLKKKKKEKT